MKKLLITLTLLTGCSSTDWQTSPSERAGMQNMVNRYTATPASPQQHEQHCQVNPYFHTMDCTSN